MEYEKELLELYKKLKRSEIKRLVDITRKLQQKYGPQVADEIAEVLTEGAHRKWSLKDKGDAGLEDLYSMVWKKKDGIIDSEVEVKDKGELRLRVKGCFYANEYKKLGAQDLGYKYCCMYEYPVVDVFNPRIRFKRHNTLMQNSDHCDHCYRIIED
ncbi:MAG: L-2-amino-thiazoline-4-carboxylic acid hydrolase [Clostridiales bacterium]|jgi:citrate lyase gamma subunit|nr:L-2-amino-thiazoline-4-carboxylic acid hydrolase [Clostridiales bacterium]HOC08400.1 L-2-amino-thiazoline-4-carboxylic acid hydrolase [Bacillota bacterium]HQA47640.1 L-2-amino-thiazoline-4-carboxylic acid hydrolase [Bacillota bacterium]HQD41456.1 L-2-amino-thiazoline-4-carboxylic acid hydrolase [Bacillota bacterium]